MRGKIFQTNFVALLLIVQYVPLTRALICERAQQVCRYKCYSPSTQTCFEDRVVCKKDDRAICGKGCVPRTPKKICVGDTVCNPGQDACDGKCYSNQTQACFDMPPPKYYFGGSQPKVQQVLCSKGHALCKKTCFNPSDPKKCIISNGVGYLCGKNEEVCGDQGCYSPKTKICSHGILCEPGESACGKECYNPSAAAELECVNKDGEEKLCPKGNLICRSRCYDPDVHACLISKHEKFLCLKEEIICGGNCFKPSDQQPCEECPSLCGATCFKPGSTKKICMTLDYYSAYCNPDEKLCLRKCYNPKTHTCFDVDENMEFMRAKGKR